MPSALPYLSTPGALKTAFERIRAAATPDRVTGDFVNTVLQIKGGTGATIPPYLKRIGFIGADGAPTDLYKRFRNPAMAGAAVADAVRIGYKDLLQANEYFYRLPDKELQALIVQVTGAEAESRAAALTFSTLKTLRSFADFEARPGAAPTPLLPNGAPTGDQVPPPQPSKTQSSSLGLNLSYTINLNLPATSDQAVFNAIFRSLKEHLLSRDE